MQAGLIGMPNSAGLESPDFIYFKEMFHLIDGGGADDLGRQDQEGGRPSGKNKEKTF